ncbi:PREDICTED: tolloid-like protein 2 isoform X1 [Acropora digitifera]|uniref:tolloid-like protein 2 isoform X1 n=1 Tax=Acropora digitifera TaxID=70779 RepID=UPI00077A03F4|nr:PREDICTED: tolloid-like protein 2 isoform X1 [Acropora digitifera]
MASFKSISFTIAHVFVVASFLEKGFCDDICPHGITNITGKISGGIVYPISGIYGPNETKCWRIEVPKPYFDIAIIYHRLEIEECLNCECDSLSLTPYYRSIWWLTETCGQNSPDYLNYLHRFQGPRSVFRGPTQNLYLRLKTDDSIHLSGINISFIVGSYIADVGHQTFLNVSSGEISTPKFGSKNYSANFNWEWYLLAPEGHQIQIKFESFELEQSDDCQNDYLEIREAYFEDRNNPIKIQGVFGAVLEKPKCGTDSPGEIHSAGNMVWVHFHSDRNPATTSKGFKATFTSSESTTLWISYSSSLVFFLSLITVTAI